MATRECSSPTRSAGDRNPRIARQWNGWRTRAPCQTLRLRSAVSSAATGGRRSPTRRARSPIGISPKCPRYPKQSVSMSVQKPPQLPNRKGAESRMNENEAIVRNAYQVAERKDLDAANLRTQNGYVIATPPVDDAGYRAKW